MAEITPAADTATDAMNELIGEGIPCYLDALYAINRFKTEIAGLAQKILRGKVAELASALAVDIPPPERINRYCNPDGLMPDWNGSWAWVATSLWFGAPLWHSCYFGLTFESRDEKPEMSVATVRFIHGCQRKKTYEILKPAFVSHPDHYDLPAEKELGFSRPLRSHETMEDELREMADRMIAFWKNIGGWEKLVPLNSPVGRLAVENTG